MFKSWVALAFMFCLSVGPHSAAQDKPTGKVIHLSDLSDNVDLNESAKYLKAVDEEIAKLVDQYHQLSDWNLERKGPHWSDPGKKRSGASLEYGHGLTSVKSSNYLDWYGPEGFHLRIEVISQRQLSRLQGGAIDTVVFGRRLGNSCVVAEVMSAKPKVEDLESKVTEIIKKGLSPQPCY